ncbi:transmembrane protein 192 [Nephila pilipes]|uniref:Transmembrane protein 192 n=1 Tax=Nephila pilipes TaxID=299642 RepID=A0A8X6UMN6_NEPPI|nr:transmembrane protein 192 [Nephila pilipes]
MVSLGNDHRGSGGGYFFNRDAGQLFDETDEASLISSVLISNEEPNFKTIPITGVIVFEIFLSVALFTSTFLVPFFVEKDVCFILSCAHAVYWCILFASTGYRNRHHANIQRCGYLDFSRSTQILQKMPLIVPSLANCLLVVVVALFLKYCPQLKPCPEGSSEHCENYLQILFGIEMFILLLCLIKYLFLVVKFNKSKAIPDVHQDELLTSYVQSYAPTNEIGFRDEDYMDEVLEKQADMIRYLKQHCNNLSRKILRLNARLESMQSTSQRF